MPLANTTANTGRRRSRRISSRWRTTWARTRSSSHPVRSVTLAPAMNSGVPLALMRRLVVHRHPSEGSDSTRSHSISNASSCSVPISLALP